MIAFPITPETMTTPAPSATGKRTGSPWSATPRVGASCVRGIYGSNGRGFPATRSPAGNATILAQPLSRVPGGASSDRRTGARDVACGPAALTVRAQVQLLRRPPDDVLTLG